MSTCRVVGKESSCKCDKHMPIWIFEQCYILNIFTDDILKENLHKAGQQTTRTV